MPCKRCGQCCTYVVIKMQRQEGDEQNMERWFENHHLRVFQVPGKEGMIGVRIPLTCRHLEYDTATATAYCMDYENRPQMCRDYICPLAKGETPEEIGS